MCKLRKLVAFTINIVLIISMLTSCISSGTSLSDLSNKPALANKLGNASLNGLDLAVTATSRGPGPYHGGILSSNPITVEMFTNTGANNPYNIVEGQTAGGQFFATTDLNQLTFGIATYASTTASFTISLYAWSYDYYTSVHGTALVTKNFTNFNEASTADVTFNTLDAGEYVWQISNVLNPDYVDHQIAIWTDTARSYIKNFKDGFVVSAAYKVWISYVNTPTIQFIELLDETSGGKVSDNSQLVATFNNSTGSSPIPIAQGQTAGMQFIATTPFNSVQLSSVGWNTNTGNMTISLYNWNTDYKTSVSGTPIKRISFTNILDNQMLVINPDTYLPPGEYVWEVTNAYNPNGQTGFWSANTLSSHLRVYVNGAVYPYNFNFYINYIYTPVTVFNSNLSTPAGLIYANNPSYVAMYNTGGTTSAQRIERMDTAAGQFKALDAFDELQVCCPSYSNNIGNLTLSLYSWNTNYMTTVAGNAIAKQTFTNFTDGAYLKLAFNALPAGEYLWELSGSSEMVGVWVYTGSVTNIRNYFNSVEGVGSSTVGLFKTDLHYLNTPAGTKFGILSATGVILTGIPPAEIIPGPTDPTVVLDNYSDTWTATDGLGRTLPTYATVGAPKAGKYVGLFYSIWHYSFAENYPPRNINSIITQTPSAKNDFYNTVWEGTAEGTPYFWNEPLFGYYSNLDRYVVRKHAELLANAGIDVIIFDCTNGTALWRAGYMTLCDVFMQARAQGVKTPKIAFILPFAANADTKTSLKNLYFDLYLNKRYQDLWFYWKSKPLIMAWDTGLSSTVSPEKEIKSYFTFRNPQPEYNTSPGTAKRWGWLNIYPQKEYKISGALEEMTVGVAQNWNGALSAMNASGTVFGRSYSGITKTLDISAGASLKGINFQEQWNYAISKNPQFIFITGWNEWIAGRASTWQGTTNAFPDEFNDEFSRDIEPSKGALKDNYYYQMVSNIRKFKGVRAPLAVNANKTINIGAGTSQWTSVTPEYRSYEGSIPSRDSAGWVGTYYTNNTGRNDVVSAKVAYDSTNIYFMVKCANNISSYTDPSWMRLFLDTTTTGNNWEGYEYVINTVNPSATQAVVGRSTGGWNWTQVGNVNYNVSGQYLQISIPRSMLGITGAQSINFKWSDNMQVQGDIMDFYVNGEAVPGGRFNYNFTIS